MKKLTIEHLAPYFPYKLKAVFFINEHKVLKSVIYGIDSQEDLIYSDSYLNIDESFFPYVLNSVKPIMRPLSDLIKEIEVNGDRFVPIEKLRGMWDCDNVIEYVGHNAIKEDGRLIGVQALSYVNIQFLLEWHFDIFGLIDNNLAIDINTL